MPEPGGAETAGGPVWRIAKRLRLLFLFAGLAVLPYVLSYSQQEIAVLLVVNVLLVCSYRLLTLTGEWSLGHVVIMGVGAYTSALLAKRLGVPVPVSLLMGGVVAAGTAAILSFPLFRMKGFYFLIGSFAAGEIIRLIWKRFTDPFRRPQGAEADRRLSQYRYRVPGDRFLRAGQLLFSRVDNRFGVVIHPLSDRAVTHRADLPRHPLAGQAGRIRRRRYVPLPERSLSSSRPFSPGSPAASTATISAR